MSAAPTRKARRSLEGRREGTVRPGTHPFPIVRRFHGGVARSIALGAFGLAISTALWDFPGAFVGVSRDAEALRSASVLERELIGPRRVDVDTRVFIEARRLIPERETYAVVTGPNVEVSTPATLFAVAPFSAYWLLPRRRLRNPSEAEWVVSYGADLRRLGLDYVRVVDVAPGISIAEVRR